jgi:hypothetical protein
MNEFDYFGGESRFEKSLRRATRHHLRWFRFNKNELEVAVFSSIKLANCDQFEW